MHTAGKSSMPAVLGGITAGQTLRPGKTIDKAAPAMGAASITQSSTRKKSASMLAELEGGTAATSLKPVGDKCDDRSQPVIEAGVGAKPSPAPACFAAIEAGASASLKSVKTNDKSSPVIDSNVKIAPTARPALFDELKGRGER